MKPIEGMPGWNVRELSVMEWNDLETIRADTSKPKSVVESTWLATLMAYSVVSDKEVRRWSDMCEVNISDLTRHGEAVADAALEVNGFGEDSGNA